MMKCPLNILKRDERASFDYRSNGNVLFAQWKDNSVVSIGSNFSSITPLKKVNHWVKGAGKVAVDQPNLIADYNTGMGGVDLLDMQLASYRPKLTSKKWWWPLFNNALNIAMVVAFRIYKRTSPLAPERQLSHLEFCIETAACLVKYEVEAPRARLAGPTAPVPDYIQQDGINHECVSCEQTQCVTCKKNCRL